VDIPTSLLADLHAPDLVITADYVGPRPGTAGDPAASRRQPGSEMTGRRRHLRAIEAVGVALVSVVAAVSLTLIGSHHRAQAHTVAPHPARVALASASAGNRPVPSPGMATSAGVVATSR